MNGKILYQHGTLGALMAGLMDGTETITHILEHGTLGLGTLHGLDGEVMFLDGKAYQARSDGSVVQLTGTETTPYAAITNFCKDSSFEVTQVTSSEELKKEILVKQAGSNLFLAIKITGMFQNIHTRVMPKQSKPYHRLAKISESQPEFQETNLSGTLVGFYTPALFQGVAAAGFHLHFIDDTKQFGGHVIDFELTKGKVELSKIENLVQHFPINDVTFVTTEIDYANLEKEIEQAE
ncbi:acetolactate decarboxylase [Enterococcus ratti]|uniref:acetolactate decarboxylase n=1 Tax=Enterococcus ratti TaxID=150033 RepID=UPI003515CBBF